MRALEGEEIAAHEAGARVASPVTSLIELRSNALRISSIFLDDTAKRIPCKLAISADGPLAALPSV